MAGCLSVLPGLLLSSITETRYCISDHLLWFWDALRGRPLTPATNTSAPIRHPRPDFFQGFPVRRCERANSDSIPSGDSRTRSCCAATTPASRSGHRVRERARVVVPTGVLGLEAGTGDHTPGPADSRHDVLISVALDLKSIKLGRQLDNL